MMPVCVFKGLTGVLFLFSFADIGVSQWEGYQ